jgi:hypothetical protein
MRVIKNRCKFNTNVSPVEISVSNWPLFSISQPGQTSLDRLAQFSIDCSEVDVGPTRTNVEYLHNVFRLDTLKLSWNVDHHDRVLPTQRCMNRAQSPVYSCPSYMCAEKVGA